MTDTDIEDMWKDAFWDSSKSYKPSIMYRFARRVEEHVLNEMAQRFVLVEKEDYNGTD